MMDGKRGWTSQFVGRVLASEEWKHAEECECADAHGELKRVMECSVARRNEIGSKVME